MTAETNVFSVFVKKMIKQM